MDAGEKDVVVVGDVGAGKTSLVTLLGLGLAHLTSGTLPRVRKSPTKATIGKYRVCLHDTDTSDEGNIKELLGMSPSLVIIVFDTSNENAEQNIRNKWYPMIRREEQRPRRQTKEKGPVKDIKIILVGTHTDKRENVEECMTKADIELLTGELQLFYFWECCFCGNSKKPVRRETSNFKLTFKNSSKNQENSTLNIDSSVIKDMIEKSFQNNFYMGDIEQANNLGKKNERAFNQLCKLLTNENSVVSVSAARSIGLLNNDNQFESKENDINGENDTKAESKLRGWYFNHRHRLLEELYKVVKTRYVTHYSDLYQKRCAWKYLSTHLKVYVESSYFVETSDHPMLPENFKPLGRRDAAIWISERLNSNTDQKHKNEIQRMFAKKFIDAHVSLASENRYQKYLNNVITKTQTAHKDAYTKALQAIERSELAVYQQTIDQVQQVMGVLDSNEVFQNRKATQRDEVREDIDMLLKDACENKIDDGKTVEKLFHEFMKKLRVQSGAGNPNQTPTLRKKLFRIFEKAGLEPESDDKWTYSNILDLIRESQVRTSMIDIQTAFGHLVAADKELYEQTKEFNTTSELNPTNIDIVIVRIKERFSTQTSGGWADILVNFYFKKDPHKHICEVQLAHKNLLMIRNEFHGHKKYNQFRTAFELLNANGIATPTDNNTYGDFTFSSKSRNSSISVVDVTNNSNEVFRLNKIVSRLESRVISLERQLEQYSFMQTRMDELERRLEQVELGESDI
eukprot:m.4612 g.4612  ORF g.4612 m.4612 type:complete len:741 (+) comp3029_c0_seq2:396-2618(+)